MTLNSLDNKIVQAMLSIFGLCHLRTVTPTSYKSPYVRVSNTRFQIEYVPAHSRFYVMDRVKKTRWSSDGTLDDMDYVNAFLEEVKGIIYGE